MRKPPTGEPCAGEPHARFGGRGGVTLPDPYHIEIMTSLTKLQIPLSVVVSPSKSCDTWVYMVLPDNPISLERSQNRKVIV